MREIERRSVFLVAIVVQQNFQTVQEGVVQVSGCEQSESKSRLGHL